MMTNDKSDRGPATLPPMMRRQVLWMVAAASVTAATAAGCKFDPPPALVDADPGPPDGETGQPDAETGCTPDAIVCDEAVGRYTECSSAGVVTLSIECPLGCATDVEKCLDVAPSNQMAGYLDQARTDDAVLDVTFSGSSTINTDDGHVMSAGQRLDVPTATANGIRILMFKNLQIPGTLKVTGSLPLAILADGVVAITGLLDVSADIVVAGPGAITAGDCLGGHSVAPGSNPIPGAGGAGRATGGARGGYAQSGSTSGLPGLVLSDPDLIPLVGGCRGGTGGYLLFPAPPPNGGGGGGAVQISARGEIVLEGGGTIDASGGGGDGAGPGAGGGSGGGVLLEAPSIRLDGGGVVISTKGGSGSGSRSSTMAATGSDGGTSSEQAPGGALAGYASGGAGGTDLGAPAYGETGGSTNTYGGGGGASVGEARFNTAAGTIAPTGGAAIRSRYTTGTIGSRVMN